MASEARAKRVADRIQEVLADLYVDTGDDKYLDIARVFNHEAIIDSLRKEKDIHSK